MSWDSASAISTLASSLATTKLLVQELEDVSLGNELDVPQIENQDSQGDSKSTNSLSEMLSGAAYELARNKMLVTESIAIMDHDHTMLDSDRRYKTHLQQQRQALEERVKEYQAKEKIWVREKAELTGEAPCPPQKRLLGAPPSALARSTNSSMASTAASASINSNPNPNPNHNPNPALLEEVRSLRAESFQMQLQLARSKESTKALISNVANSSLLILETLWASTSASEGVRSIIPAIVSHDSGTGGGRSFRGYLQEIILAFVEGSQTQDNVMATNEHIIAACGVLQNCAASAEGREALLRSGSGLDIDIPITELLTTLLVSIGHSDKEAQIKTRVLAALSNLSLDQRGLQEMNEQKAVAMLINAMRGEPSESTRVQCIKLITLILSESQFAAFESEHVGYDAIREMMADQSHQVRQSATNLFEAYMVWSTKRAASGR